MKINKMLIAVTAMLAVVLSGCKEDETVGIDASMPMPTDVAYDEVNSSNQSIGVIWDARQAISAGATSFTVQLVKTKDGVADMYDSSTSQTILTTVSPNDATTFSGLTAGRIYYIRIRANYPRSVFSEWTFAMANGEPARIMVGTGIVDESQEETSSIVAKVEEITESTAIARWSTSNYNNDAADAGFDYTIELFKDAACTDLDVSWNITEGNLSISKYGASFIFSGLTPATDYWFRVTNTTDDVQSDAIKFTTAASQFKTLPETANEGDIILFQDFHELLWGGDLLNNAGGYSNNARGSATEIDKATGVNPVSAEKYYIVNAGTEMGLFNTLGKAVPNTSLADWGQMSDASNTKSPGIICARPGMLKMGASSYSAWIVTPELKCLTQPATIEVTFDVAPYDADQSIVVELLDGTKKSNSPIAGNISATSRSVVWRGNAGAEGAGWSQQVVTVPNVTSTCRIAIGAGESGDGAAQHRFYLDNISLKVVSYGELSAPDAPARPTLTATDKTITASWEAVSRAKTYTVEYKKTADSDWKVAAEKIAETTCTIEGLEFETQYDVRVKALIDDLASDYSEVAQITTLAEIKKLDTPSDVKAVPGLGWAWLQFAPVMNATGYEVYSGDSKVESRVVSAENAETVNICVSGLTLNAPFTFKVKAIADGIEASDFSTEVSGTTGNIRQMTNNVGPTHLSINWDDVSGGSNASSRAYYVELAKDQAMSNPVYAVYCYDGQASTNGSFGASSWYGKAEKDNLLPPTSVTFGQLEPQTTYYFRVKTVSGFTFDSQKGTVKLDATNGESDFSPVVSFTTEAKHVAGANEILYQGFDEVTLQADFINIAAGTTPYTTDKADITNPHTGDWCVYPFANSHLLSTWGMAAEGTYIDGEAAHNGYDNYVASAKAGSLEGWHIGEQVSPHQGYVKIGTSSKTGYYLATPALESALLDAGGTACTFSFKGCPLMTDATTVDIEVYRAATKAFEKVTTITMDSILNTGWTASDYLCNYKWTTYSVDITLAPGDNVAIVTTNKNRLAVDDITIVKK